MFVDESAIKKIESGAVTTLVFSFDFDGEMCSKYIKVNNNYSIRNFVHL